jgi:hypothetical protein
LGSSIAIMSKVDAMLFEIADEYNN